MAIKINGEVYQFIHSLTPGEFETIIEIDNSDAIGQNAQFRFTDVNQPDPAGRFRILVSADAIEIQGATFANWGASRTLMQFDRQGFTSLLWTDAGMREFLDHLQLFIEGGGEGALRLRQILEVALLS